LTNHRLRNTLNTKLQWWYTWWSITGSRMESQKKNTELHLFKKNRFGEIKSCNLQVHDTDQRAHQCQQGFEKFGHKRRGRK
jgi:hypothetical protein